MTGFSQTADGVRIELAEGGSDEGDMVIFADGMGSTGRGILAPEVSPSYAGYVAWRGTVPEKDLSARAREALVDFGHHNLHQHREDG